MIKTNNSSVCCGMHPAVVSQYWIPIFLPPRIPASSPQPRPPSSHSFLYPAVNSTLHSQTGETLLIRFPMAKHGDVVAGNWNWDQGALGSNWENKPPEEGGVVRVLFFFKIPVRAYYWLRWVSSGVATTELQSRKPLKQPQKQDTACDVTIQ